MRLFRLAGTDVYLHWAWFVAAWYFVSQPAMEYTSSIWGVAEYAMLFGLVLLHEFGHVLACRQVGGTADRVVLWPLGGLAYVQPPPRPGPSLWTTAAGPLVNLALVPVTLGLLFLSRRLGWEEHRPDLGQLVLALVIFNLILLIFNLLPIFPLDGGRILQVLLWFAIGRPRSLLVASAIGLVGGGLLILLALASQAWWSLLVAGLLMMGSWAGLAHARLLAQAEHAPRRADRACPYCHSAPPAGDFWRCSQCHQVFDLFGPDLNCPRGGQHQCQLSCLECERPFPRSEWLPAAAAAEKEGPSPAS